MVSECSPGETWYTLTCLGEMAPTFEPSRKTVTPPSAGLRRWSRPRPSRDTARITATVGYAGQTRLGICHSRIVAPPLVAATTSDLSRSCLICLFYIDRQKRKATSRSNDTSVSLATWRSSTNSIGACATEVSARQ